MVSTVRVKKSQLEYFRKLARNTDLEIQAYLIGEVISPTETIIKEFVYPKTGYHTQTSGCVRWFLEEYRTVRERAEERGERVVGDLHSHPNWDAVMSEDDYTSCIEEGFRICGICSTEGRKTRIRFWTPSSALPCDMIYDDTDRITTVRSY